MSDLGRLGKLEQILEGYDARDPHVSSVDDIVRTWEESKEAAVTREKEREDVKTQKTKMADKNRRDKTSKMIQSLSLLLEDKEWKEFALSYYWQDLKVWRDRKRVPLVFFRCGVVNSSMHFLLVAPSKANKKAIEAVADQITGCFDMIYAKRFHDFSFLSNDLPFESKLRAYCEERYSGGELLMTPKMNGYVVTKIEDDDLLEALVHLMGPSEFCDAVVQLILLEPSCQVVEEDFQIRAEKMVRTLWGTYHNNSHPPRPHEQNYQECVITFPRLFAATKAFLECPAAIEATNDVGRHPNKVWGMISTFEPLLEGDFTGVMDKIRECPWHFSM
jgi:hypothetical protein